MLFILAVSILIGLRLGRFLEKRKQRKLAEQRHQELLKALKERR